MQEYALPGSLLASSEGATRSSPGMGLALAVQASGPTPSERPRTRAPRVAPTANLALPLAPQLDAPPLHENEDPTSVGKRTRPGGVPEGVLRPNSPRSPSATSPGSVAKAGVIAPLQPAPVMPAPFTMRPSSPARPAPIDAFAQGSPGKRSRSLRQQGR